ncbi:MAG: 3-deoxy-manno-octulosonate cytidylyltransferase [Candidatus Omnitrophota bacterium]
MDVIGVIPARYASSRLEGKVLADILGKPMIQHVWERAHRAKLLDDLLVACDDERVAEAVKRFGGKAVMTAKAHTCGTDRIAEVVYPLDVKAVVNIQADEPLLHPVMIDQLAQALLTGDSAVMATLAKRIEKESEINDPNVVKVVLDRNNQAIYFSRAAIPHRAANSEVASPAYYKHIGMYGYTKDFLFTYKNMPPSSLEKIEKLEQLRVLESGYRIKVIETRYETVSVDTAEDLERVKAAMEAAEK